MRTRSAVSSAATCSTRASSTTTALGSSAATRAGCWRGGRSGRSLWLGCGIAKEHQRRLKNRKISHSSLIYCVIVRPFSVLVRETPSWARSRGHESHAARRRRPRCAPCPPPPPPRLVPTPSALRAAIAAYSNGDKLAAVDHAKLRSPGTGAPMLTTSSASSTTSRDRAAARAA